MGTTRQAQVSTRGRPPPAEGRHLCLSAVPIFLFFFKLKKKEFLEVWEMGQGFCENGCTAPPLFEACPYTWKF
jgi:hypothetical protein